MQGPVANAERNKVKVKVNAEWMQCACQGALIYCS